MIPLFLNLKNESQQKFQIRTGFGGKLASSVFDALKCFLNLKSIYTIYSVISLNTVKSKIKII